MKSAVRLLTTFALASAMALGLVFAAPKGAFAAPGKAKFTASVSPASARAGEVVTVQLDGVIEPGFHLYSIVPVVGDGPIPTSVAIEADGAEFLGVSEARPEVKFDKNFNRDVGFHEGKMPLVAAFRVGKDVKPGPFSASVSVRYQACDATGCQPPKRDRIELSGLSIEAGAARAEFSNPPAGLIDPEKAMETTGSATSPTAPTAPTASQETSAQVQGMALGPFLGWAFGAGLLALLTPCVFPMVPVTFSYFTKLATGGKEGVSSADVQRGVVKLALLYCAGIVASFVVLGVGLAVFFGAAGASRLATNPYVNAVFGVLFVIFGLALLEVFELRLPYKLQNLSGAGRKNGGTVGVFLMGLTFVISAFTCAAPFLGTVMVAAASAQGAALIRPVLGMGFFALALALPFALLALFPSLLAKLPRSGGWLTTVKGAMGFLELAAAVKFLSNADLVWNLKLIPSPVFLSLWVLCFLGGALWLLGILKIGFNTPEPPATPARRIWSGVFLALAIYSIYGLTGRPLGRAVDALLPPNDYGLGRAGSADATGGLSWVTTLEAAKKEAAASGKRIVIDFTGHACTNCREVEKYVFPVPGVKNELEQFVRLQLHTDNGTPEEDANQDYQLKTFGTVTTPLYAVLNPDGTVVAHTDYLLAKDADKFAAWLKTQREVH